MIEVQTKPDYAPQMAAAIGWWREAGVEHDFADEPRVWMATPEPVVPQELVPAPKHIAAVPASELRVGGAPADWPTTLDEFTAWWLAEPTLDHGQVTSRLAPRGPARAELMLLVDYPEEHDRDLLLSGRHGKLLSAMLEAMGIAEDAVYFASALPRHTPMPDWAALKRNGLSKVLAHHIQLAAPKRLIVFGRNVSALISSPLDNDPAKIAETLPGFNHEGTNVPLLGATGLDMLLSKPRGKARFWELWLAWTGTNATC